MPINCCTNVIKAYNRKESSVEEGGARGLPGVMVVVGEASQMWEKKEGSDWLWGGRGE